MYRVIDRLTRVYNVKRLIEITVMMMMVMMVVRVDKDRMVPNMHMHAHTYLPTHPPRSAYAQ